MALLGSNLEKKSSDVIIMKQPSQIRSRIRSGFTLMELMVVIAIILVLATMVISGVGWYKRKAAVGKTQVMMASIERALEEYSSDSGVYPAGDGNEGSTADLYKVLYGDPDGDGKSNSGETVYLSLLDPNLTGSKLTVEKVGADYIIMDAWFEPFRYLRGNPAAQMNPDFDLWSLGVDGKGHPNGDAKSKQDDLTNWK